MSYSANKGLDFGRDNASDPPVGLRFDPASDAVSASALSEINVTAKTGAPVAPGSRALDGRLAQARVDGSAQVLSTNQGVPIADNQNSLKAGLRGPVLLEDSILHEKLTHFDHERIVHPRGSAAHGFFETYGELSDVTCAAPFAEAGKVTPVFVRFSTVAGERGLADTVRDARGFAVKFCTEQGT